MIGIRDEYAPRFGRQVLTVWEGTFASEWLGEAHELPRHDGFMVTLYNGQRFRVACPSPRTEVNFTQVDEAIRQALLS